MVEVARAYAPYWRVFNEISFNTEADAACWIVAEALASSHTHTGTPAVVFVTVGSDYKPLC